MFLGIISFNRFPELFLSNSFGIFLYSNCSFFSIGIWKEVFSMTQSQKEIISQMLAAGEKTAKIAEVLGISPNTIKSYLRRKKQDGCPNCGKPLIQLPHKRQKKFCSGRCRSAWWRKQNLAAGMLDYTCVKCGSTFKAYPSQRRKYCTVACYRERNQHDEQ